MQLYVSHDDNPGIRIKPSYSYPSYVILCYLSIIEDLTKLADSFRIVTFFGKEIL